MLTAGTMVKGGFYFNRDKLDIITMSGKEGTLPGADGQRYLRVPVLAVLFLAPVFAFLFVVFMPLIGVALVLRPLFRPSLSAIRRVRRGLVYIMRPVWRPGKESDEAKTGAGDEPGE
jgi:hypothetical protein